MSSFVDYLEDNLNPILFYDLRKTVRSNSFWLKLFFLLFVYCFIFYVLIVSKHANYSREYILTCYRVLAFFFLSVFIAIPINLRKITINDIKSDNIFFIFMSNVTALKFINGKFLLGLFYTTFVLLAAIPVYIFVYYTKAIEFYQLLRIFFYSCVIPIPLILGCIYIGFTDGREKKAAQFVSEIVQFGFMLFYGFLAVELGVYVIRDGNYNSIKSVIGGDLIAGTVFLVISAFTYLFLYTHVIKKYPLSEATNSFIPKQRNNVFSYKLNKSKTQNSNFVNMSNVLSSARKTSVPATNVALKTSVATAKTVLPSTRDLTVSNALVSSSKTYASRNLSNASNSSNDLKPHSYIDNTLYRAKSKENILFRKKGEKTGTESIIKYLFTGLFAVEFVLVLFNSPLNAFIIRTFYFLFGFLTIYFHCKDKFYDNRTKLEIPTKGLKRYIKFPFVSGYANGIVWLSLIALTFLIVLSIRYGASTYRTIEIRPGLSYVLDGSFEEGYFVLMAFMFNISSWCFLGRFISEFYLNNDAKDDKTLSTIITIIFVASFSSGFFSKDTDSLNLIQYFLPSMPMMTSYYFFKKPLAFLCNLIFFFITIIPHYNSMREQAISYFNKESN